MKKSKSKVVTKTAILIGSISGGFRIGNVVNSAALAHELVKTNIAEGNLLLSEAIEIFKPSSLDKKSQDYEEGDVFVAYGSGLGNGYSIFGPFPDEPVAKEFAAANQGDDDWEIFVYAPKVEVQDRAIAEQQG